MKDNYEKWFNFRWEIHFCNVIFLRTDNYCYFSFSVILFNVWGFLIMSINIINIKLPKDVDIATSCYC